MFTQIIVQTLMAFAMGIFSLILVYKILNEYLNRRYQLSDARNTAYGVFQTGVILSTSLILKTIVDPAISGFRLFAQSGLSSTEIFLVFLYSILFVVIGVICTLVLIAAATMLLFYMSRIKEWEEIKKDNVGVALISASVLIGLSLVMGDNVGMLCETILPYPKVLFIP